MIASCNLQAVDADGNVFLPFQQCSTVFTADLCRHRTANCERKHSGGRSTTKFVGRRWVWRPAHVSASQGPLLLSLESVCSLKEAEGAAHCSDRWLQILNRM